MDPWPNSFRQIVPHFSLLLCKQAWLVGIMLMAIVEKGTGNIVWRMGPEFSASYDYSKRTSSSNVPRPVETIVGQHSAHMIRKGLPWFSGSEMMKFNRTSKDP